MSSMYKPKILTFKCDAAIAKGSAVKLGTDSQHVAIGTANTDRCIGIAQNTTTTAEDAIEVALPGGGAKGLLFETVVAGNDLVSHTDGTLALPNAQGDEIIARALEGGVAGDLISVVVSISNANAAQ